MARNRYEYETSPRKLEPEYIPTRKKKVETQKKSAEQKRENPAKLKQEKHKKIKQTLMVLAFFAVLLTISYRNSQINEKFNEIQKLKQELALVQKENEQTKVNIENSLNLNNIEQVAKEKLGMQKLSNQQTVYVALPKKDYVETASEEIVIEKDKNIVQKIFQAIVNF